MLEFLAFVAGAQVVFDGEEVAAHVFPAFRGGGAEALRGGAGADLAAGGLGCGVWVVSASVWDAGHARFCGRDRIQFHGVFNC